MIDFDSRLKSLKDRRQGTRERNLIEKNYLVDSLHDPRIKENYENLKESSGVKYAIGAMAPVNSESTKVSISEGNRVADTLIEMLSTIGISTTKRIQGSVALDIHINGHSDVDMLILLNDIHLVETPKIDGTQCYASDTRPMKDIVGELRRESENKLVSRYYQATVDCTNNKSISLEGGSLQRKVDIVPSCWYDTHEYQRYNLQHDRGVKIYHKGEHRLLGNFPFKHIKYVNDKDALYDGNLKRVIRLMKNMVADMPDYKKRQAKKLTSYDLAAIGFHMDSSLQESPYNQLALVEKLRYHLDLLKVLEDYRDSLYVPDGTRKIFDSEDKKEALRILSQEVDDLATSIFKQLKPYDNTYDSESLKNKLVFI